MISLLVGALYNIVDQIFIANASYLGSYGNAANTVVFPLTVIALGIAVCIGDGCCAMVSGLLGAGKKKDAEHAVGNAALLAVLAGVLLTVIYLLADEELLTLFGGRVNAETFAMSREYFFFITLGIPFYLFGQAMNPVIRADGSPKFAMASTLVGAVANIILDPIFIFVCKWGMMGAAVATVIGQVLTAALAVWYLFHTKSIRFGRRAFALQKGVVCRILSLGLCSFLAQISLVAAMAAINNMLRKYGARDPIFGQEQYAQIPMAVVGIVMKFFQIVISVVIGMAAGCIPIVGYNMGANRPGRVRDLFVRLLISETVLGAVALLIAECFPGALIGIFGAVRPWGGRGTLLKEGSSPSPSPTHSPRTSPRPPPVTEQKFDLLLQVAGTWGKSFVVWWGGNVLESAAIARRGWAGSAPPAGAPPMGRGTMFAPQYSPQ